MQVGIRSFDRIESHGQHSAKRFRVEVAYPGEHVVCLVKDAQIKIVQQKIWKNKWQPVRLVDKLLAIISLLTFFTAASRCWRTYSHQLN